MAEPSIYQQRRQRYGSRPLFAIVLLLVLAFILLVASLFCAWVFLQRMERMYKGHIYPNIYALGVDLGAMTPDEAATALEVVASQLDTGLLVLTDGDDRWSYAWSEVGMYVDTAATAQAAYAVGRDGGLRNQARIWLRYHDVAPRFTFDTVAARGALAELSREISRPPVDPILHLDNGIVSITPGEAGRVLNESSTLARLQAVQGSPYRVAIPLAFDIVPPPVPDTEQITAQVNALLARTLIISAYDVLTDQMYTWTFDREIITDWLHLVPGPEGEATVDVNLYAIRDDLMTIADGMKHGQGFRYDEAARRILETFDAGGGNLQLYLTHPERVYTVQAGDTLTSLSAKFGMPPGLVAEANPDIDIDHLSIGQALTIPSQDILTPYMPIVGKKIVVNLDEQRARVYEQDTLTYDWPVSTGIPESPTHRGIFQVREKHEKAYASQWDLWMPYFIAVYPAGGGVDNGFHELPILSNGNRLWAGSLGHPASYGCIILGIPEAETLYNWADIGIVVVVE